MKGRQLSPEAAVAAVALHGYAKSPVRPTTRDEDISHDKAVLHLEDTKEKRDETTPPTTRKLYVGSLGTTISSKAISKREPLPMKLRALPKSFWEQPNTNQSPSPGYLFAPLPPLSHREETMPEGVYSNRSLNSSAGSTCGLEFLPSTSTNRGEISPADTDLLFSLFRTVEKYEPAKKVSTVRRGRPRRGAGSQLQQRQIRDDDPCLVSSVTEQLLPTLSGTRTNTTPVIKMVSVRAGTGSRSGEESLANGTGKLALPCLQVNANYSQILSDLVVKL